jgi:hypothetical protein
MRRIDRSLLRRERLRAERQRLFLGLQFLWILRYNPSIHFVRLKDG